MKNLSYKQYHDLSMTAKDVDPAVICLKYIAERFELNTEQRYWIAFLYGTNYCAPTTFYMYNEFPDYQKVDPGRLSRWWSQNKDKLIFQTDRKRIKSNNQFIASFMSYRSLVRNNQEQYFRSGSWQEIYKKIEAIKYFGRFSLFNYLDVLNNLTNIDLKPAYLNMIEAESCRNGLCYAISRPDLVGEKLDSKTASYLHYQFLNILKTHQGNIFQIETTLCAYKKYMWGKRYIGYYIDRMYDEIVKMEGDIKHGVAWELLWQFRSETFESKYLKEHDDYIADWGLRVR